MAGCKESKSLNYYSRKSLDNTKDKENKTISKIRSSIPYYNNKINQNNNNFSNRTKVKEIQVNFMDGLCYSYGESKFSFSNKNSNSQNKSSFGNSSKTTIVHVPTPKMNSKSTEKRYVPKELKDIINPKSKIENEIEKVKEKEKELFTQDNQKKRNLIIFI